MMRTEVVSRWAVAVIAVGAIAASALWASPLAAQQGTAQQPKCQPAGNALGVSRTIEIDAAAGPRFGRLQYREHDFLQEGEVVLTFDDGPHPTFTPRILEALDEHCTKATFFILGQRALSFPAQLRDVGRRGHTIATHSWSHRNLGRSSAAQIEAEIELGISAVQLALDGPTAPFFRFPYLSDPAAAQRYLQSRDIANISIDVDSNDFRTKSPSRMISNVLRGLQEKKKGIILFHDIQPSTAHGIRQMLAELKARGYRVVHIKPKQSQSTIAAYDERLERSSSPRVAAVRPSPAPVARPAPQQVDAPPPGPPRPRERDWRDTVFGRW
jgi:peptidoglycan-N-acetylglucosamine deacetylase